MTMLRRRPLALSLALGLSLPVALGAQIRASERGSVSQTVDGTVVTVDYARPRVRARDSVFGGVVHWQEVWTPGANYATTLEVNKPVTLDGHPVPKGKYSLWFVVGQDHWTVVLDPRFHRYHTEHPDSTADQIRYPVHPAPGPFTEVLSFTVPVVRGDGMVLLFQWASVQLPLDVKVEPSHPITVARGAVEGLLGSYRYETRMKGDSSPPAEIALRYQDGRLMMHWEPAPFPDLSDLLLIRIADDWFMPATLEHGEVYDVISELVLEFTRQGKVVTFEMHGDADELWGVGSRK